MSENSFIQDYLLYNSGNMSPQLYHRWAAHSVLATALGRRVFIDHSYFKIHTNLFICLVGRQGLRKSTAKDIAKDMFLEVFPDFPVGASVQSREDIVKRMAQEDMLRVYTNEDGASIEWRPMVFYVNELKNFLSINPAGMIEFLTDIYDVKMFDASTIKHGLQTIINPCINILACETPRWIMDKLKMNIISGGFSRRMLFVYETERPARITFPRITEEMAKARERCIAHLNLIKSLAGPFKWESLDTVHFFDEWFKSLETPDDEILEGYYEAQDILALKLTMLIAAAQPKPELTIKKEYLEIAIAELKNLAKNLPKLTVAAGRNELAIPQQRILEILKNNDGLVPVKRMKMEIDKDLDPGEQKSIFQHLQDTERIYLRKAKLPDGSVQMCYILDATYEKMEGSGDVTVVKKDQQNKT